jgi:hypothetical protein
MRPKNISAVLMVLLLGAPAVLWLNSAICFTAIGCVDAIAIPSIDLLDLPLGLAIAISFALLKPKPVNDNSELISPAKRALIVGVAFLITFFHSTNAKIHLFFLKAFGTAIVERVNSTADQGDAVTASLSIVLAFAARLLMTITFPLIVCLLVLSLVLAAYELYVNRRPQPNSKLPVGQGNKKSEADEK